MIDGEGFRLYLLKLGLKRTTIENRLNCLRLITKNCKTISRPSVDSFILSLKDRGISNAHLNNIVCTARRWGQFTGNKALKTMPLFAKRYRMKATMSDAEIEAFIALPAPKVRGLNKAHYFLWTLFFSLMAYTGMRPGEVAGLSVNDVDFGRGVFVLKDTKTNEPRTVPIPVNVLPALQDRLKNCQGILFPGVDNTDWHYNFHTRVKRLGIVRDNLTPYSLRHSFITTLLSEGSDLFATQHIVGHHDIRTTAHYYHLDLKAMKRAQEKHPIIRKETSPNNILQAIRESIKSFGLEHDGRFKFYLSESNLTLKMEISII